MPPLCEEAAHLDFTANERRFEPFRSSERGKSGAIRHTATEECGEIAPFDASAWRWRGLARVRAAQLVL